MHQEAVVQLPSKISSSDPVSKRYKQDDLSLNDCGDRRLPVNGETCRRKYDSNSDSDNYGEEEHATNKTMAARKFESRG